MRWIDYKQWTSNGDPDSLPSGAFLECETWSGKPVVVPSEYARIICSNFELIDMLGKRPRAEVIENYSAVEANELSVSVS